MTTLQKSSSWDPVVAASRSILELLLDEVLILLQVLSLASDR